MRWTWCAWVLGFEIAWSPLALAQSNGGPAADARENAAPPSPAASSPVAPAQPPPSTPTPVAAPARPSPPPVLPPLAPSYWQAPRLVPYATVNFTSEPDGLAFHRVAGFIVGHWRRGRHVASVYQPLCLAPCTLGLPPGVQEFALSAPGDLPRRTGPVTIPNGSSEVHGYFESRAGIRTAGWLIFAGSVVAGVALIATSFHTEETCYAWGCAHTSEVRTGRFVAGAIILPVGGIIGAVMGGTRDVPHIEVR